MARLPNIERFHGDNKQSFSEWIQIFIAQLEVLDIDEEKFKQTFFALCEGKAFTFVSQCMASRNNAIFTDMKKTMMEEFCGEVYKRRLEIKLQTIKFTEESNIPLFSLELKKLIKELYSIEDNKTIKLITSNHVVANLEPLFK